MYLKLALNLLCSHGCPWTSYWSSCSHLQSAGLRMVCTSLMQCQEQTLGLWMLGKPSANWAISSASSHSWLSNINKWGQLELFLSFFLLAWCFTYVLSLSCEDFSVCIWSLWCCLLTDRPGHSVPREWKSAHCHHHLWMVLHLRS